MIHCPQTAIVVYCNLLSLIPQFVSITPPLHPLRRTGYRNKLLPSHTHKGVTSFCHREKIACFPLTSLYIPLLGDWGVNIGFYGDSTSPSKLLLTFLLTMVEWDMCVQNREDSLALVCNIIIHCRLVLVIINSRLKVTQCHPCQMLKTDVTVANERSCHLPEE